MYLLYGSERVSLRSRDILGIPLVPELSGNPGIPRVIFVEKLFQKSDFLYYVDDNFMGISAPGYRNHRKSLIFSQPPRFYVFIFLRVHYYKPGRTPQYTSYF